MSANSQGARISGTVARPHCLADEIAIFCHRSWRRPLTRADSLISVRAVTVGWMANTPIITASRIDIVHLVALEDGLDERHADARLGCRRFLLRPDGDENLGLPRLLDHGLEFAATAVENADGGAFRQAEHAGQVLGLVFGQRDDLPGPRGPGHIEPCVH